MGDITQSHDLHGNGVAAPGQALLAVGGGTLAFVRCIQ